MFHEKNGWIREDAPIFYPWESPTRKDGVVHVNTEAYQLSPRLFLEKYQQVRAAACTAKASFINFAPSTMTRPIGTRIHMQRRWNHFLAIYLMGHHTVLAPKGTAPMFSGDDPDHTNQMICFDITFAGDVGHLGSWGDRGWFGCQYPLFYDCAFTERVSCGDNALFINCHGKLAIIGPKATGRFFNCQFDAVAVVGGRLLAKNCEFGTIKLVAGGPTEPIYFLDDCTVREMKSASKDNDGSWILYRFNCGNWPDPREVCHQEFAKMSQAFQEVGFHPDQ